MINCFGNYKIDIDNHKTRYASSISISFFSVGLFKVSDQGSSVYRRFIGVSKEVCVLKYIGSYKNQL